MTLKDKIIGIVQEARSSRARRAVMIALSNGMKSFEFREAGQVLERALPLSVSIDNLIEHRSEEPALVECAKICIAAAILDAEANSLLAPDENRITPLTNARESGLFHLFQIIMPGLGADTVRAGLANVAFVNFNYDRCLELFLYEALQTHSGFSEREAARVVSGLPIWHPYGVIGRLPWQDGEGDPVPFGAFHPGTNLSSMAEGLKTFSEEISDSDDLRAMRTAIAEAVRIVFLGLAFNEQNMKLMRPPQGICTDQIFGTCFKPPPSGGDSNIAVATFAKPDIDTFEDELLSWKIEVEEVGFSQFLPRVSLPKELYPGFEALTCRQLLAKYENVLRRHPPIDES
ncbi:MAG: hypothetical protein Q8L23_04640 [Caulobacter sp.]|nr:hypothetical protein [Caulobacter sp.]